MSDGSVKRDPVHPRAEGRFFTKTRQRLPNLNDNLLEQVFPVVTIRAIKVAYFINQRAVIIQYVNKFSVHFYLFAPLVQVSGKKLHEVGNNYPISRLGQPVY
jgi:hypothetical protein